MGFAACDKNGWVESSFETQLRSGEFDAVEVEDRPRVARAVLEAALDSIIVIDADGLVVEWNPAASELFGYSRTEVLGELLADLIIPEELRESHRSGLEKYLETGEGPVLNTRVTVPGQRADGSRFTVELAISPSEGPDGPLFTGWLRDVTDLEEARESIARSEERLAALIANISDVITVLGPDGSWLSSSDAGIRLLGYEPGYDPPGGIFSLLHPDDVGPARAALDDLLEGRRSSAQRIDLRVKAADGSYHVMETVAEDRTADPSIAGVILSSRDVTLERAATTSLRETTSRLEYLVASLSDGVLFLDDAAHISVTNSAFCDMFAIDTNPLELVGLPVGAVADKSEAVAEGLPELWSEVARCTQSPDASALGEIKLADGRLVDADQEVISIDDGESGRLWIFRDITERKAVESARERLLAAEREARETAEEQNAELQRLADLKTELVAMVSHELRTPLTSIVSFADLLREDLATEAREEQREFLDVVDRNAKRLLRLVDDLLLLGQLDSGVISVSAVSFPVERLFETILLELGPRARDSSVELTGTRGVGPPIHGDEGRLFQVLENLTTNAIKLAPEVSRIELNAKRGEGCWIFSVADDGPGISEEDQGQLFEKFYRVSTRASASGTGLGLAISRSIVELHDGHITVHSELGKGTEFRFVIPDVGRSE